MTSDFYASASKDWKAFKDADECTLIRLSILKGLIRNLHAERSRQLASGISGARKIAENMSAQEEKINELLDCELDYETLDEALNAKRVNPRVSTPPPGAGFSTVFSSVFKDKFDRFDRKWDSAIALEAVRVGWTFWALDAWVGVKQAEPFHASLGALLWPKGVLLFVENAPGDKSFIPEKHLWKGRWYVVFSPEIVEPSFRIEDLKGYAGLGGNSDDPAKWTLLYSTKNVKK